MARYILVAETECADPSREEEFNEWYNNVHIVDLLKYPGMVQAVRYKNLDPEVNEQPKYLAIYEIEADDIDKVDAAIIADRPRLKASGRGSNLIKPVRRRYYKQIMAPKKAGH